MLLETTDIRVSKLTYFSLVCITYLIGICKKEQNKSQIEKNTYVIETEGKI